MPLATLDEIVAAPKRAIFASKATGLPAFAANAWMSYWQASGPGHGAGSANIAATGAGARPTRATAGAAVLTAPGAGNRFYLLSGGLASSQALQVYLMDRVWHSGPHTSVNGNITSQTLTADITDYGGEELILFAEIATALSATATNLSVVVRHNNNSESTFTASLPASAPVGRAFPFTGPNVPPPNNIKNIVSMSGSAAPTGTFNLVVARKIATLPVLNTASPVAIDPLIAGLAAIRADACLTFLAYNPTGTVAANLLLSAVLAEAT